MKYLTGLIFYDRPFLMRKWLHAWSRSRSYQICGHESPLVVIHNQETPRYQRTIHKIYQEYNPDFLIERPNVGCDIGAFCHLGNREDMGDWDVLFWFTDDMMPMRLRWMDPFVEKIGDAGLVGFCYEPEVFPDGTKGTVHKHFRTTAFGIRREVFQKLKFPDLRLGRSACFDFEHGNFNMTQQVLDLGYNVDVVLGGPVDSPEYVHWTNFADWMWDCQLQADRNLWEHYNSEYGELT